MSTKKEPLSHIDAVRMGVEIGDMRQQANDLLKSAIEKIGELRERCPHELTHAFGNGAGVMCNVCGKQNTGDGW